MIRGLRFAACLSVLVGVVPSAQAQPTNDHRNPIELFASSNDALGDFQWNLDAPPGIDAGGAWDVTFADSIKVAIVDTGIDDTHPDLAGKVVAREVVCGLCVPGDQLGHGTAVSGVVAATINNFLGIAGAANVGLIDVEVYSPDGAEFSDVATGIKVAADLGADIINLSLGCEAPCYDDDIHDALSYAIDKGALPVCATGNSGAAVGFPASDSLCLAVSALDTDGTLATFSNHGPEVGVAAPGVDIWTTKSAGTYGLSTGTSVAAPHVSATAALALAADPKAPLDLMAHLEDTAIESDHAAGQVGAGWVNACAAVAGSACKSGLSATLPRTVSEPYVTGASLPPIAPTPVGPNCGPEVPPIEVSYGILPEDTNLGGACFGLFGTESEVDVTLFDATSLPVAGAFAWLAVSPAGETGLESGPICGHAELSPPSGANQLRIWMQGPAAPLSCGPLVMQATLGEIVVDFS